jgi:hypothetical protein
MPHLINPSDQTQCVCVWRLSLQGNSSVKCIPSFRAKNLLDKVVPAATNTCYSTRIVGPRNYLCDLYISKGESVGLSILL